MYKYAVPGVFENRDYVIPVSGTAFWKKIKKYFRQDICQCVHIPSVKKLESNKRKNLYIGKKQNFQIKRKTTEEN